VPPYPDESRAIRKHFSEQTAPATSVGWPTQKPCRQSTSALSGSGNSKVGTRASGVDRPGQTPALLNAIDRLLPVIGALTVLGILGLIDAVIELRTLASRIAFTTEYERRWMTFFPGQAQQDYVWLAEHQTRMTTELGPAERVTYRAPLGLYIFDDYPILTNTLANARGGRGVHPDDVNFVDHLLISWNGVLKEHHASVRSKLKNPIYLIGRGVRFLLSLPLLLLSWSGLVPPRIVDSARASLPFRFVQFIVSLILLLAGIVTLITGWSAFVTQIRAWWPWLP